MKKTAVEWYIKKIKEARKMCDDTSMEMDIRHTLDVLIGKGDQAKEVEKQQIIDAYHINPLESEWKNIGIDYYNETFKSE